VPTSSRYSISLKLFCIKRRFFVELQYERKLYTNPLGSTYLCLPIAIMRAFGTDRVKLIFDGSDTLLIQPLKTPGEKSEKVTA
jgi:hypothetical protein